MPLLGTTAGNQALNGLDASGTPANQIGFASLHTATPGTTGASEATGGGYARIAVSWNAASALAKTNSSSVTWSTTGLTANSHAGAWSLVTGGNFGIGLLLSSSVTAASITAAAGALSVGAS